MEAIYRNSAGEKFESIHYLLRSVGKEDNRGKYLAGILERQITAEPKVISALQLFRKELDAYRAIVASFRDGKGIQENALTAVRDANNALNEVAAATETWILQKTPELLREINRYLSDVGEQPVVVQAVEATMRREAIASAAPTAAMMSADIPREATRTGAPIADKKIAAVPVSPETGMSGFGKRLEEARSASKPQGVKH